MKLKLENLTESNQKWIQNYPTLVSYLRRGFFQTETDVQDLHSSYSPFSTPQGLNKIKIRRRINKFVKNGRKLDNSLAITNRLTVAVNDKVIIGVSFAGKVPENKRQINKLLRNVIKFTNAPKCRFRNKL